MSSGYFSEGVDLDSLFELISDYPNFGSGANVDTNYIAPNGVDLRNRYVWFMGTAQRNTHMIVSTPFIPARTETFNEGGEIITVNYPAIPAGEKDLSQIFARKGNVAAYYNYPYILTPPDIEIIRSFEGTVPSGTGTLTLQQNITFNLGSVMVDPNLAVSQHVLSPFQVISGTLVSSSVGSVVRATAGSARFGQSITFTMRTVTSYNTDGGYSEARVRVTAYAVGSNGLRSDASDSPYPAHQKTTTFDVVMRHTVRISDGGGPIQ